MSENQPIFPMKSLSFGPIARPDSRPPAFSHNSARGGSQNTSFWPLLVSTE